MPSKQTRLNPRNKQCMLINTLLKIKIVEVGNGHHTKRSHSNKFITPQSCFFPNIGQGGGGGVFDGIGLILALQPSGRNSILGSKFTKGVYEVLYHNHSG